MIKARKKDMTVWKRGGKKRRFLARRSNIMENVKIPLIVETKYKKVLKDLLRKRD